MASKCDIDFELYRTQCLMQEWFLVDDTNVSYNYTLFFLVVATGWLPNAWIRR